MSIVIGLSGKPETAWQKERAEMARNFHEHGIAVVFYPCVWPQDRLLFAQDGRYAEFEPSCDYPHEAFNGGKVEVYAGNMIASTSIPEHKRGMTEQLLSVHTAAYIDPDPLYDSLIAYLSPGRSRFYRSWRRDGTPKHTDIVLRVVDGSIVTYETDELVSAARPIADGFGLRLVCLPPDEAEYAALGFVIEGGRCFIDERAATSAEIMNGVIEKGVVPIKSFDGNNSMNGTLRCATKHIPFNLDTFDARPMECVRLGQGYDFVLYDGRAARLPLMTELLRPEREPPLKGEYVFRPRAARTLRPSGRG